MTLNLTADPERVKHLLITARDELQARGWTKHHYGSVDGPKCTLGALAWADNGNPSYRDDVSAQMLDAEYVIRSIIGTPFIGWWNDEQASRDRPIAVLSAAARLVDAEIARRVAVAQVQEIAGRAGIEVAT